MEGVESSFFRELKGADPFFLMAGPNVIQSEEHIFKMCRQIKHVTDSVGVKLVFKASFDKANRTSAKSFRGPGVDEGLKILRAAKTAFDVPIVTDIHESYQAEPVR
jgi:2-dehydro-3-deoxyphosphooctonate aldolase (KDO 8-P synthase)